MREARLACVVALSWFGGLYHDVQDYWKNDLWSWDGHAWSQLA